MNPGNGLIGDKLGGALGGGQTAGGTMFNYGGRPASPKWSGIAGKDGTLKSQYQIGEMANPTLNTQGLEAIRSRALNEGPSAWAGLMNDKIGQQTSQAMDDSALSAAGAKAEAMSDMAMSGGISSGSRERLAGNSMRDQLRSRQELRRGSDQQRLDVGLQDEEQRLGMLGQLPGMELQALEPEFKNREFDANRQEFNIKNSLEELKQKRGFDLSKYSEDMRAWAAANTANAQSQAANNSGGLFSDVFKF